MKSLFLSVAAAAALAVSAGSAAAQYNTVNVAPAPAAAPAPTTNAPAPYGYSPAPVMAGYDGTGGCAGGCCGHLGYLHGAMGGMVHGKLGGHGGGKFLGGGLGIFSNHGHPFGKEDGGSLFGGFFGSLNGGSQIQPVDPRSGNAGQLVFPQHPFYRGPRDYFMLEDRY